ncbi:glycosyltransferase [Achromobacter denitrificans]|uniref:glycosyltransferase family 2 protein n=1 Tax=Achromobacter TaxID=222 RepID=UPI00240DA1B0|nr:MULTISPECIES: glycosyltransferase family 2 protein [Achromobacter]WFC68441.1 glycosyltransferase [Achromobacter denitrificans]BEG76755.1 Putative glycosyltransferase CsbB [Achromobacter xylosoxidans]
MKYSLIIPVYRNAANVPSLVDAIVKMRERVGDGFEVVFVIDGSPDNSAELLMDAAKNFDFAYKIAFHSRNFGSFAAIRTGLGLATGKYLAVMAADLQEPPELIEMFFQILENDEADVVFGQRVARNDPFISRKLSELFWGVYRRYVVRDMPAGGVDIFACNRSVLDATLSIVEPNSSLIAQLFWVGFRRKFVPYTRRRREHGVSAWNLSRRFRYMMDSILAFSDLPIMIALWLGIMGCSISVVLSVVTAVARITGYIHEAGYASLFILIMFFGSLILMVQGILGCYTWRTAENTKRRPLSIVSHVMESPTSIK